MLGPNGKPEFTKKLTSAWPHMDEGAAGVKLVRVRGRARALHQVRVGLVELALAVGHAHAITYMR
jgi:hypothetical protein